MTRAVPLVEVWRGEVLESVHAGHAVICDSSGDVVQAWGDPGKVILPRSSSKMIQALPLVESGAADAAGLTEAHLALACASHQGAAVHSEMVTNWLADLGLGDDDLRCGPEEPRDIEARDALIRAGGTPCQYHNNCSGKHSGFLTLTRHLGEGPEYIDPEHPVQKAVREAIEDVTQETSPTFAIDGCSAPNFAATLQGYARAMAFFANARDDGPIREKAAARLRRAMAAYPELVAGTGRACTELMQAMQGRVSIKTGAEGVFFAIVPEKGLGVALKIADGATRASECALASILVGLGVLDPDHPATLRRRNAPVTNRAGRVTGYIRPADGAFSA